MTDPFFSVTRTSREYQIQGTPRYQFGHRLPSSRLGNSDGIFAEWVWDGTELAVTNDRYGLYPLYYFLTNNGITISSSIPQLVNLGAPIDLDETALAVFLRVGFFLGEDTPFKAIRLAPPEASFNWRKGELHLAGHQTFGKLLRIARPQAMDNYIELFRQAMGRRLSSGPVGLPLSGGRDSRHILLELCRIGHAPDISATMRHLPPRGDGDVDSAATLTAALNVRHAIVDQPDSRLLPELRKNLETSFSTLEHGWIVALADYLKERVQSTYDGVAGDVLSAGHFLDEARLRFYQAGDYIGLAQYLCSIADNVSEHVLASMLTRTAYGKLNRELAVNHLAQEIEKHANAPNPVGSFFFWNRTRRVAAISPYGLFNAIPNVYSPFVDHDLFDFLASLPSSMFLDHGFHTETIARAYPQFAEISYEKKDYSKVNRRHFRQFAFEVSKYYAAHRSPLIRETFLLPRLLRCIVQGHENISWLSALAIYLGQLESIRNRKD